MNDSPPRLFPSQVCFVVDDVAEATRDCEARFGWGPFHSFSAPIEEAHYRGWSGPKHTDVALGMAGRVQVELIHVREGHDAVEAYQARYGRGFQHLGVGCRSREEALAHLEALGGVLHEQDEYPGIRFAFVDIPTGPAMFELLQPVGDGPPGSGEEAGAAKGNAEASEPFEIDRATIATADLDRALAFYAAAFGWSEVRAESQTLRIDGRDFAMRRAIGKAGTLELELVEPVDPGDSDNPYSAHLARGDHGLVHAGGAAGRRALDDLRSHGEWLETGEGFGLHDFAAGPGTLQLRA